MIHSSNQEAYLPSKVWVILQWIFCSSKRHCYGVSSLFFLTCGVFHDVFSLSSCHDHLHQWVLNSLSFYDISSSCSTNNHDHRHQRLDVQLQNQLVDLPRYHDLLHQLKDVHFGIKVLPNSYRGLLHRLMVDLVEFQFQKLPS